MELPRKAKRDKSKTYKYVIKRASKPNGCFNVNVDESVELPKFICLVTDFSDHLDQRITDPLFEKIAPKKRQAYVQILCESF